MDTTPVLSRITIYPVKSLDGMTLEKALIAEGGCVLHDREFVMTDEAGKFITGKTNPLVHSLRSEVDFEKNVISFRTTNETSWRAFHLADEKEAIESFLSGYFGFRTILLQNQTGRFMDIPDISGVTILSTSSLQEVASWFNDMDLGETRKRFRATLELQAAPAFGKTTCFRRKAKELSLMWAM